MRKLSKQEIERRQLAKLQRRLQFFNYHSRRIEYQLSFAMIMITVLVVVGVYR